MTVLTTWLNWSTLIKQNEIKFKMATNVLLIFIISFMSCKLCPSKIQIHQLNIHAEVQKKLPSNKQEISIKHSHLQKYYWLITTVKILSMHTSYKHQSWQDPLWKKHTERQVNSSHPYQVHRIGTFFIHLLKQEDSSIRVV